MNDKNKIKHDINTRSKANKNSKAHLIGKPHSPKRSERVLKRSILSKVYELYAQASGCTKIAKKYASSSARRGSLLKMKRNTATASRDKHYTTDSFPIGETHHLRTMLDNYGATYASSSAVEGIKEKTQPGTGKILCEKHWCIAQNIVWLLEIIKSQSKVKLHFAKNHFTNTVSAADWYKPSVKDGQVTGFIPRVTAIEHANLVHFGYRKGMMHKQSDGSSIVEYNPPVLLKHEPTIQNIIFPTIEDGFKQYAKFNSDFFEAAPGSGRKSVTPGKINLENFDARKLFAADPSGRSPTAVSLRRGSLNDISLNF